MALCAHTDRYPDPIGSGQWRCAECGLRAHEQYFVLAGKFLTPRAIRDKVHP